MKKPKPHTQKTCERCTHSFTTVRPWLTLCPGCSKSAMHREMAQYDAEREERARLAEERHREFLRSAPPPTEAEGFLARAAEAGVPGAAKRLALQQRAWPGRG